LNITLPTLNITCFCTFPLTPKTNLLRSSKVISIAHSPPPPQERPSSPPY
jgi:hypothetical protein